MKSVLIIDDDFELAQAISAILCSEGYEVRSANSGKKGLELALERAPGVLMLDWQMPFFSGKEVLAQLESQDGLSGIPLILMSAHLESIPAESIKRHLHIRKPFDADALIDRVKRAVRVQ